MSMNFMANRHFDTSIYIFSANCLQYSGIQFYIIAYVHYLVENIGVEPMTSCVQGKRSSQLS